MNKFYVGGSFVRGTVTIFILTMVLVFFSSAPVLSEGQPQIPLLAKAVHACGERSYVLEGNHLSTKDESAVRDIISLLYNGASILFQYPNAPQPIINEKTRKYIADSYTIKSTFEARKINDPSPQQINDEVQEFFSLDPVSWNIHEGTKRERILQILSDSKFAERLGPETVKLIESRLKGELGQRPEILAELDKRFHVKEVPHYWSDENCHIYDGFGAD